MSRPRVIVVGAGLMGRTWVAAAEVSPDVELAAVADLDLDTARAATAAIGRPELPVGSDVVGLAAEVGAEALIDVTVPAAHHPITTAALFAGLPVLGEKPAADSLARALSLAAASEVTGQLFMVSQSRRWNPQLFALREMVADLGAVGIVGTEFFRAPHFGGFREKMDHPLLVDMAIHAFDSARFLLDAEPVSVYCQTFNPPWSWYDGDAAATAVFEMEGGVRYTYTGSWCSPGAETSWNGAWRVSGEKGTALWDGDHEPVLDADLEHVPGPRSPHSGIAGALAVFVDAVRTATAPMGEVHENALSLAMVEAAVWSARAARPVLLDDVLAAAHADALREETHPEVRAALASWSSVRGSLTGRGTPRPATGPGPGRTVG